MQNINSICFERLMIKFGKYMLIFIFSNSIYFVMGLMKFD